MISAFEKQNSNVKVDYEIAAYYKPRMVFRFGDDQK
jgi:hypothetical protein